jgi:hypothetical protein
MKTIAEPAFFRLTFCGAGRLSGRLVPFFELLARRHELPDDPEELPRAVHDGGHPVFALGDLLGVVGGERRRVDPDLHRRAYQRVAEYRRPFLSEPPPPVHRPGLVDLDVEAGEFDEPVRRVESFGVADLADDHRPEAGPDAGYGKDRRIQPLHQRLEGGVDGIDLGVDAPRLLNESGDHRLRGGVRRPDRRSRELPQPRRFDEAEAAHRHPPERVGVFFRQPGGLRGGRVPPDQGHRRLRLEDVRPRRGSRPVLLHRQEARQFRERDVEVPVEVVEAARPVAVEEVFGPFEGLDLGERAVHGLRWRERVRGHILSDEEGVELVGLRACHRLGTAKFLDGERVVDPQFVTFPPKRLLEAEAVMARRLHADEDLLLRAERGHRFDEEAETLLGVGEVEARPLHDPVLAKDAAGVLELADVDAGVINGHVLCPPFCRRRTRVPSPAHHLPYGVEASSNQPARKEKAAA